MGRDVQKHNSWTGVPGRYIFLGLLTIQSSAFVLTLHYTRVRPVVGGKRYIPSTAVFLSEIFKLAICLTVALYDVSKSIPPSMPATSLFGSLTSAIFAGDSWKLALPAALYTVSNSLQYMALSNLEAAQFQVTYQAQIVAAAILGMIVMRRYLSLGKWVALLLLVAGIAVAQISPVDLRELDRRTHIYLPRRLSEIQYLAAAAARPILRKRSATYEGIQDDMIQAHPPFDHMTGLLSTLGACIFAALASVSFEKVLKDSTYSSTSVWVRNVQLTIYSIFPALFLGVVFLDGEQVAKRGFFQGYDWTVWTVIGLQALGGIATSFCISLSELGLLHAASAISIISVSLASPFIFELQISAYFIIGTLMVLLACLLFIPGGSSSSKPEHRPRLAPIRIQSFTKAKSSPSGSDGSEQGLDPHPHDFSIKLPTTPLISESSALTTSRPASPSAGRHSARAQSSRGYFAQQHRES